MERSAALRAAEGRLLASQGTLTRSGREFSRLSSADARHTFPPGCDCRCYSPSRSIRLAVTSRSVRRTGRMNTSIPPPLARLAAINSTVGGEFSPNARTPIMEVGVNAKSVQRDLMVALYSEVRVPDHVKHKQFAPASDSSRPCWAGSHLAPGRAPSRSPGARPLAVYRGVINAFDMPARQALVVVMVERREDLPNAIALNSSLVNAAGLVGSAAAGAVIAAVGVEWCFVVDAASCVGVLAALLQCGCRSRHGRRRGRRSAGAWPKGRGRRSASPQCGRCSCCWP
jgi:hypothetical protein